MTNSSSSVGKSQGKGALGFRGQTEAEKLKDYKARTDLAFKNKTAKQLPAKPAGADKATKYPVSDLKHPGVSRMAFVLGRTLYVEQKPTALPHAQCTYYKICEIPMY